MERKCDVESCEKHVSLAITTSIPQNGDVKEYLCLRHAADAIDFAKRNNYVYSAAISGYI